MAAWWPIQGAYASSGLPRSNRKGPTMDSYGYTKRWHSRWNTGMASVVIGNTPPTVGVVSITPTGTIVSRCFSITAITGGSDETPLTSFVWSVGGNVVGTASTIDLATTDFTAETIVCTVTATDGDGATEAMLLLPLFESQSEYNSQRNGNGSNQMLRSYLGNATDPDGETPTVTYEWFNGINGLGTSNPLQLDSTIVTSGDIVDVFQLRQIPMVLPQQPQHLICDQYCANHKHCLSDTNPAIEGVDDLTCSVSVQIRMETLSCTLIIWSNSLRCSTDKHFGVRYDRYIDKGWNICRHLDV